MSNTINKGIAYAVGGLLLGGLLVFGCAREGPQALDEDEDRPPIIVKGGSLTFESGTPKRAGKAWKKIDQASKKNWDQDHDKGKKITMFQVYFVGGTGACAPETAEEFTVNYDHDGDGSTAPRPYIVTINKAAGKPGPMISSDYIDVDPQDQKRLVAIPTTGKLVSVKIGDSVCSEPKQVWIESLR